MPDSDHRSMFPTILDAKFQSSAPTIKLCPKPTLPEHAFIGRSNVGKSSLINMLTGKKNLAKTSSTPGKTRLINHFVIDQQWYLADLPGYGYARVSKSTRETWPAMIRDYLTKRRNLLNTFILIDIRLEPQAIDLEFIRWLGNSELPFSLVFTKADKLSNHLGSKAIDTYSKVLLQEWEELPPAFRTSAHTGDGREEILEFILETNSVFVKG
jgi:GTP-binding protein